MATRLTTLSPAEEAEAFERFRRDKVDAAERQLRADQIKAYRRTHPYYSYYDDWRGYAGLFCCTAFFFVIFFAFLFAYPPPPPATPAPASAPVAAAVGDHASVESTMRTVRIENHWVKVADGVYDIGEAGPPGAAEGTRERVRGRATLMYAAGQAPAPMSTPVPDSANDQTAHATSACVGALAPGARWNTPLQWIIDPTNPDGISRKMIVDSMWVATNELERFLPAGTNVVTGQDVFGCSDGVDANSPDNRNEIEFGFVNEPGVLAIMYGWTDNTGAIVSADIIFNLHFPWGNSSADNDVYDVCSVGAHEIGHAYGLAHTGTEDATMQPTAALNEIKKRDLLPCERAGLCNIYGASASACAHANKAKLAPFVDTGYRSRCGAQPPTDGVPPEGGPPGEHGESPGSGSGSGSGGSTTNGAAKHAAPVGVAAAAAAALCAYALV